MLAEGENPKGYTDEEIKGFDKSRAELDAQDNETHDRSHTIANVEDLDREKAILAKQLGVSAATIDGFLQQADINGEIAAKEYDEKQKEDLAYQELADRLIVHTLDTGSWAVKESSIRMGENDTCIDLEKMRKVLNDRIYEKSDDGATRRQKVQGFDYHLILDEGKDNRIELRYNKPKVL